VETILPKVYIRRMKRKRWREHPFLRPREALNKEDGTPFIKTTRMLKIHNILNEAPIVHLRRFL
jgi:hypothetical protein